MHYTATENLNVVLPFTTWIFSHCKYIALPNTIEVVFKKTTHKCKLYEMINSGVYICGQIWGLFYLEKRHSEWQTSTCLF